MSPLREEAAEDSLYSSFEGSEMSDQEGEERHRQRRREGRAHPERKGVRETRRKGETVQPRLLTVGAGMRVELGEGGGGGGGGGGEEVSDGGEDVAENAPARKISDCSNRSVDSGTKMSEASKDDDDFFHRKLSDLSEASQNDFEMEEEEERKREHQQTSESPAPTSPSLPGHHRPLKRSGSVHNKIDFFNKWIQQHHLPSRDQPGERRKRGKRWQLLRTQSAMEFTGLPAPSNSRRGSLLPVNNNT